jgi:hypothetical protein
MIDKPKEDENQKSESNRFVYEPGELQPYDPNDKSELTETGEDETRRSVSDDRRRAGRKSLRNSEARGCGRIQ